MVVADTDARLDNSNSSFIWVSPDFVLVSTFHPCGSGEKPGSEPEEAKLQIASKQIVQNAILRAVQQVSRESRQREAGAGDTPRGSFRPGAGELTKKHEKK
ncbi:hypothetical protein DBR06_SOUSAS30710008 [Sousa chinensis]|uniref:A-kinase anchor protein 7 RI-RII subunit-binding domain-containing protein n=1 Tax=Sousa chinensis TaxID=103600 RepID=A0A484GY19_SOUCH|nr:hypothetical protein DBR06_SOUSAS30710008 [Sousa chinensis]